MLYIKEKLQDFFPVVSHLYKDSVHGKYECIFNPFLYFSKQYII